MSLWGKPIRPIFFRAENFVVKYYIFKGLKLFALEIKNLMQKIQKFHVKYMEKVNDLGTV